MNIVIVEDEFLLADELQEKLEAIDPKFNILVKLHSVEEAVDWFAHNDCDLIFMDIQLSDGTSFSIFDQVTINAPVIFTTAYDHYTMQAFGANGIAYILKPIDESDLNKALDKYEILKESYQKDFYKLIADVSTTNNDTYKSQMLLTQGASSIVVDVSSIVYFHAEDRYVFAIIDSGRRLFCSYTLRDLEDILDPNLYFRISRSFIINKNNIVGWESSNKGKINLILNIDIPTTTLTVSRLRVTEFKEWLQN